MPPVNALRITLHPDGLASAISNLSEWRGHLLARLQREFALSGDPAIRELRDELASYPGPDDAPPVPDDGTGALFLPLRLRTAAGELSLFSTIATFGTALDVTLADLMIESFYPADGSTEAALRTGMLSGARPGAA